MIKKGKVINIRGKKVHILTEEKEFVIVKKNNEPPIIGEKYAGEVYNIKLKLKPVIFLIILVCCIFGLNRFMRSSISNLQLIVQMNVTFKIHINAYDEVVKIESKSFDDNSKIIADLIPLKGKHIGEGLILLFNTCKANDLITEELINGTDSIHIFVSNNKKKHIIDFSEFENYLDKQNINVNINIDGEGNI